jgi:hypothetical protein
MKPREKVELLLIPLVAGAVVSAGRLLPRTMGTGALITVLCLVWLVQGGVRDLWILWAMKRQPNPGPARKLACLCVESGVGMTGLLLGIGLAVIERGGQVAMTPTRWALGVGLMLTIGFAARNLIFTWRPFGIRRDADHHGIVVSWR